MKAVGPRHFPAQLWYLAPQLFQAVRAHLKEAGMELAPAELPHGGSVHVVGYNQLQWVGTRTRTVSRGGGLNGVTICGAKMRARRIRAGNGTHVQARASCVHVQCMC